MFTYAKYGELIDFEHRSLKLVFGFIKSAIDRDKASYEERCKKNAENAAKGANKKSEKEPKKEKKEKDEKGADLNFENLINTITPTE